MRSSTKMTEQVIKRPRGRPRGFAPDEVLQRVSHGNVEAELTPFAGPDHCTVALHLTKRDAATA